MATMCYRVRAMRSRKFLGLVISVVGFGCAQAAEQLPAAATDSGTAADTSTADTATTTPTDTGSFPTFDDGTKDSGTATETSTGGPCGLVINELQTGTPSSGAEDYVEIHNTCTTESPSLTGWTIGYRGGTATTDSLLYAFAPSSTIAAGGYFTVGSTLVAQADDVMASGLGKDGALVVLRDGNDTAIDAVGYGNTTSKLVEGTKAPAPGDTGKSLARMPNGVDSDNNASDFRTTSPTPGAAN